MNPGQTQLRRPLALTFVYVVHRAESTAGSDSEIERDLEASIRKALPFARAAIDEPTAGGEPVAKLLVLWDVVNCDLVVVSSDESMMYDASQVVKCYFLKFEEERYGFSDENFDVETDRRSAVILIRIEPQLEWKDFLLNHSQAIRPQTNCILLMDYLDY